MPKIHATADVSKEAKIGKETSIWHHSQVREGACIGSECIFGKNVYVDKDVKIGDKVKIQNNVSVYHGVTLENGVFIGPHVCFTNDLIPRSIDLKGNLKKDSEWSVATTLVKEGASIGANATVVCGVTIGKYALIGAGSVVTKDVPDFGLVYGVPARLHGFVNRAGKKLSDPSIKGSKVIFTCPDTKEKITIDKSTFDAMQS